jgi:hypothetical protein
MYEVSIAIEGSSNFFYPDFLKDGRIQVGNQIELSKNVNVRFDGAVFCESVDAPTFIQISFVIGRDVVLPIALGLVSNWLYDKVKEKKAYKINIDGSTVELDKNKILELIKKGLKEKPELQENIFNLTVPEISNKELLMSARTLSDKSIIFDGVELSYPDNKVKFADYISGKCIEIYLWTRDEVLNALLKKQITLYAKAQSTLTPFKRTIFTTLILDSKRIPHSRKVRYLQK